MMEEYGEEEMIEEDGFDDEQVIQMIKEQQDEEIPDATDHEGGSQEGDNDQNQDTNVQQ
jgi:hypothetical protein